MQEKGHCEHGDFVLAEGCPQCTAARMAEEGNTQAGIAEAVKTASENPVPVPTAAILGGQINAVVEAREKAKGATVERTASYEKWLESAKVLIASEDAAKAACQEAEGTLRELALQSYASTGEKAVAPGVGIRVRTILGYLAKDAMAWAMEHKLALKLDSSAFEKIAKTSNLPFVTITEEPQATIATELEKVE